SIWMSVVNLPKTRASRDTVSVIPALAEILDEYRRSMGNPKAGMIFHSGNERPISVDKVGRRVIRPAFVGTHLPWYGWHAYHGKCVPTKAGRITRRPTLSTLIGRS